MGWRSRVLAHRAETTSSGSAPQHPQSWSERPCLLTWTSSPFIITACMQCLVSGLPSPVFSPPPWSFRSGRKRPCTKSNLRAAVLQEGQQRARGPQPDLPTLLLNPTEVQPLPHVSPAVGRRYIISHSLLPAWDHWGLGLDE